MSEAINKNETIENAEQETVKQYEFRKLSAEDMFLMFSIIKKVGIKEFKSCFDGDSLQSMIESVKNEGGSEQGMVALGVSVGFDVLDVILGNLPKCEKEIYQLLAQVSGMSEGEIKKDMILFTEMVIDFVKKEEFPAFIKVVSRLFK